MPIQPYLFFDGHCEEAAEFYRRALTASPGFQEAAAGLERVRGG